MQAQLPFAAATAESSLQAWRSTTGFLTRAWIWIQARKTARLDSRRLRVVETASLGDKRFVAVVQVDNVQFLIGGGPTGVALLAPLAEDKATKVVSEVSLFGETLKKASVKRKRPAAKKPAVKLAAAKRRA